MASFGLEAAFIGRFINAALSESPKAWRALDIVRPGMLEHRDLEEWFGKLSGRFAAHEPLEDPDDPDDEAREILASESFTDASLIGYAERIREDWQLREQYRLLDLARLETDRLLNGNGTSGAGRSIAERYAQALLNVHATGNDREALHDLSSILDAELEHMHSRQPSGITLPFPKLDHVCGPWQAGDVIGLSCYSGGGKSTFAANLINGFTRRGTPVIVFPTEMRERFIARTLAADAGVPQWVAEKRQWQKADELERLRYRKSIEGMRERPLAIVNRPNISPAEIITATRILRRRWPGQTVVVVVDHMHRLDYGKENPNEAVGPATKMFKNFAGDDREGGIVFILLFQPRKPVVDTWGPVAGHQIRGDSMTWNELDIHLSPFRQWVMVDPDRSTPWGTPKTRCRPDGVPLLAKKPNTENTKLSDEHVFVKADKRRIGGEGPTLWLAFDQPSGRIYEPPTYEAAA